ncbi:MAG: hypothetical protein IPK53_03375 [bacterium]|nr:hypothetical protein [bacterium]
MRIVVTAVKNGSPGLTLLNFAAKPSTMPDCDSVKLNITPRAYNGSMAISVRLEHQNPQRS